MTQNWVETGYRSRVYGWYSVSINTDINSYGISISFNRKTDGVHRLKLEPEEMCSLVNIVLDNLSIDNNIIYRKNRGIEEHNTEIVKCMIKCLFRRFKMNKNSPEIKSFVIDILSELTSREYRKITHEADKNFSQTI